MTALEYLRAENWNALAPEALAKAVADAIEAVTPGVRVGATPEPLTAEPVGFRWRFKEGRDRKWRYSERDPRGDHSVIDFDPLYLALEGGVSPQPLVNDSWATDWLTIGAEIHPLTANLVVRFARALAAKLAAAEKKYGYTDGWRRDDWMDECRAHLREHVEKGDPRDVAAYCAFLWHHGAPTKVGEGGVSRTEPALTSDPLESAEFHCLCMDYRSASIGDAGWRFMDLIAFLRRAGVATKVQST